jgi:hypothetical protein
MWELKPKESIAAESLNWAWTEKVCSSRATCATPCRSGGNIQSVVTPQRRNGENWAHLTRMADTWPH